ncbi:MAG TPA: hypoxanthine phosphoribosyltransferase [Bacteroidetes bacterium]|nr:hypoxanthine phosphoribosyltransferase [Bacteroidota bacterium]
MRSETIRLKDKWFRLYIHEEQILARVRKIAYEINRDLEGKEVMFVVILNGAFVFAADLLREIHLPSCQMSFLKLSSYEGMQSTGHVKELLGVEENLEGRTVVVVEDIVDSGVTLETIVNTLEKHRPAEILISALLLKPEAYQYKRHIDYVGFEIPNDFIVGYGLDYDGVGRNLRDIYQLK